MALDATVGGSNSNSYISESEANTYLTTSRLYITAWTGAVTGTREVALIWATTIIDNSFDFEGSRWSEGQALRWPRVGAVDIDGNLISSNVVPAVLKRAVSILAVDLLASNRLAEPSVLGLGISEAKVGPIEVKVGETQVKEVVPDEVRLMMASIGALKATASEHAGSVRLLRG